MQVIIPVSLWISMWETYKPPLCVSHCYLSFLLHSGKAASNWTTLTHSNHLWLLTSFLAYILNGWIVFHEWKYHDLLKKFPLWEYLGCFQFFTGMSKAAMNIFVEKPLHTFLLIFLSKIPRSIFTWFKERNILKAFYTNGILANRSLSLLIKVERENSTVHRSMALSWYNSQGTLDILHDTVDYVRMCLSHPLLPW